MDKRLDNGEYERYIGRHFRSLNDIRNELYYKVCIWEKKGMEYGKSMEETKKWLVDDMNLDPKYPKHVEVLVRKWIHSIDVDLEKHTGTSEWIYLIGTCDIITWVRAEVDDLTGKVIDISETDIIKYPSVE